MVNKNTIFICIASFNEEDLVQTIQSCLNNSDYPENVFFGIAAQYPDKEVPEFSNYPNVRYVIVPGSTPLGTSPTRAIAASLRKHEQFFLSIDAHMLFKKHWDSTLIEHYELLSLICKKPVITTYVPFWYKREDNTPINQIGSPDMSLDMPIHSLRFKNKSDEKPGLFELPTPTWDDELTTPYKEHYLASAHFLFSKSTLLEEVPFDTSLTYYEENTLAMRLWTRGYRLFAINKDTMWSREMYSGKDVENSWRQNAFRKDSTGNTHMENIVNGTLRCKEILLGNILGVFGAPTKELLLEYEKCAGISYAEIFGAQE